MFKNKYLAALPFALIAITGLWSNGLASKAAELNTQGGKGAKVYCYMRNSGNAHEVSWNASYALLKRQSNSMFKTSPKHAAVMITEAVVEQPNKYPNCGKYLGDLFTPHEKIIKTTKINKFEKNEQAQYSTNDSASRYSY